MAEKKTNKRDVRKQVIRIMCVAMAFLMVFSVLASILALF